MNKTIKKILTIFIVITVVILLVFFYLTRGLQEGQNIEVTDIDLNYLKDDGFYTGSFEFGRWSNEVKVTLENKFFCFITILYLIKIESAKLLRGLVRF